MPKVPAYEFHDRGQFPWLDEIEAATAEIRAECERVMREDTDVVPYIAHPEGQPLDQWAELNRSRKWSAFFLWRDGQRVDANADRCPRTAALLSRAPLTEVAGYAPSAFFSILDKKTHIPPHTGVTNSRLIVHLPLVVPRDCRFRVGSETREWQEGRAWIFDDSIEHEAWNDSEVPRAILIFDTWNPWLNAADRALIQAAVPAIKDYYRAKSRSRAANENSHRNLCYWASRPLARPNLSPFLRIRGLRVAIPDTERLACFDKAVALTRAGADAATAPSAENSLAPTGT